MADRFKRLFECTDCYEQYPTHHDAKSCCADGASMVFVCEICDRDHDTADNARACCIRDQNPASNEIEENAHRPGVTQETKESKPPNARIVNITLPSEEFIEENNNGLARALAQEIEDPVNEEVPTFVQSRTIVRPPQPDCPLCGIAQKLGRVVSCACMKELVGG